MNRNSISLTAPFAQPSIRFASRYLPTAFLGNSEKRSARRSHVQNTTAIRGRALYRIQAFCKGALASCDLRDERLVSALAITAQYQFLSQTWTQVLQPALLAANELVHKDLVARRAKSINELTRVCRFITRRINHFIVTVAAKIADDDLKQVFVTMGAI